MCLFDQLRKLVASVLPVKKFIWSPDWSDGVVKFNMLKILMYTTGCYWFQTDSCAFPPKPKWEKCIGTVCLTGKLCLPSSHFETTSYWVHQCAVPEQCWLFLWGSWSWKCGTKPNIESRQHSWYEANNRTMSQFRRRQKSWFRRKTVTHGAGLCHGLILWIICLPALMSFPVPLSEVFGSELLSLTYLSVSEWRSLGAEGLALEQTHTDTQRQTDGQTDL